MRAYLIALLATALIALGCNPVALQTNQQGNAAYAGRNYSTALQVYQRAQAEAPSMPEPVYNSGNAHYRLREFDLALEQYQQALLNADEDLAQRSLYNLGNAYFSSLQFDNAIEAYKEALRLDPGDQDAKHNLELALQQLQRMSPASTEEQEQEQPQEQETEQEQNEPENEGEQQNPEQPPPQSSQPPPQQPQEQARQLLESVGEDTQTLRGHLQQVYVVEKGAPARDW
jgi:tetratricopeptide (TPR) repeat protein